MKTLKSLRRMIPSKMRMRMPEIERGEIWAVRFDPAEGDEIQKTRPAVVVGMKRAGRMDLQIVVPITGWQPSFGKYFWMVRLLPTGSNGLAKESAADAFQVRTVSTRRFTNRIGYLMPIQIKNIAIAIAYCVG